MIIKYIGLLLICISASAYGAKMSEAVKLSYKTKVEITEFLKAIERGIKYGGVPIQNILKGYTSPMLEKCGLLNSLRHGETKKEKFEEQLSVLGASDKAKLYEFISHIGKSTNSGKELIICRECINYFENSVCYSEKDAREKSVLFRKLGVVSGILIVIILI